MRDDFGEQDRMEFGTDRETRQEDKGGEEIRSKTADDKKEFFSDFQFRFFTKIICIFRPGREQNPPVQGFQILLGTDSITDPFRYRL